MSPPSGAIAVVTLRSQDVLAPERRATADAHGVATFLGLAPGAYEVRVDRPGDQPAVGAVAVDPGDHVTVRADLEAAGTSRIVVTVGEHLSLQTTFSADRLRTLPTSGTVWSPIETLAPVTFADRMDTGGVLAGQPSLIGSRSSSWTQGSFRLDGLDITDPTQGGIPLAYPTPETLGGITVVSGLMPIEQGAPGPVVSLLARRPSLAPHGSFQASVSPSGLQARGPDSPPPITRLESWSDGRVAVGGPLPMTRSGGFLSAGLTRARTAERADPDPLTSGIASVFGQAVFLPTSRDEVRVIAAGQRVRRPFAGRARLANRRTTEVDRFLQVQSRWGRVLESGTTWVIETGAQHGRLRPDLEDPATTAVERLEDGPVPELASATGASRWRWTGGAHFRPALPPIVGRNHAPRFGASVSRSEASPDPLDLGPTAEQVDGLPARVWEYGYPGGRPEWRRTTFAVYAADRLDVSDRLGLEAGVRFDATEGSAAGAPQGISWRSVSASLSGRWSQASGAVAIFGGYRRYPHQLPLRYMAFGDPAGPRGIVYRWSDPNADGVFQAGERGPLIAYVGPGATDARSTIDPDLQQPFSDEVIVGFETRWLASWRLRFVGSARRERQLLASVNVGVPDSRYTVSFIPDPGLDLLAPPDNQLVPVYDRSVESFGQDRLVLTHADLGASYKGLELTLETPPTSAVWLLLGATASTSSVPAGNRGFQTFENDQGVVGEVFENPNARTFAAGRAYFDRGYSMNLAGSVPLPHDVSLAAVGRYQDGQAFARYLIAPDLNQGPEAIRAFPNGRARFTYTFTLDLRLEKGVRVGSRRFVARLDVFNLFDTTHEVEEDIVTGPAYRTPTAVQPPRAVRLTGRFEF